MMIKVDAFGFTATVVFFAKEFLKENPEAMSLSAQALILAFKRSKQGVALENLCKLIKIDEELHAILNEKPNLLEECHGA